MTKAKAASKKVSQLSKLSTQAQTTIGQLRKVQAETNKVNKSAQAKAVTLAKALFPNKAIYMDHKRYKTVMAAIREECGNDWIYRIVRKTCAARFGGLMKADGTIAEKAKPGAPKKGMNAGKWIQSVITGCETLAVKMTENVPSKDVDPDMIVLCTSLAREINKARAAFVKYQEAEAAAATPVQDVGKKPSKAKVTKAA